MSNSTNLQILNSDLALNTESEHNAEPVSQLNINNNTSNNTSIGTNIYDKSKNSKLTDVDAKVKSTLVEDSKTNQQVYAIGLEFVGSNYRGWQRQQEVLCVQEVVENAISKVANEPIEVVATGRTDAGVHAGNMVAHFKTTAIREDYNWLRGVNSLLADDISLRWIQAMPEDFHARFSAIARRYRYITLNQPQRPAVLNHLVTHIHEPLNLCQMQKATSYFAGTHDFTSFRAAACQSNQPIRNIHHAKLIAHGQFIVFDIQADGFLHHMVRNLMGTLFAIGKGELLPEDYLHILNAQDRTIAPATASADGLYFINAYYPKHLQTQLPNMPLTPQWLNLDN